MSRSSKQTISNSKFYRPDLLENFLLWVKDQGAWGNIVMGFSFFVVR